MTKKELYESKKRTLQECHDVIQSGDTIMHAGYGDEPINLLRQLHTIADRVKDVNVWVGLGNDRYLFNVLPDMAGKINTLTVFYGQNCREAHPRGNVTLLPTHLHCGYQEIMRHGRHNVFLAAVTPMDEFGFVRTSLDMQWTQESINEADTVIFEINPNLPLVHGLTQIPIEKATYVVEVDTPMPVLPEGSATEEEKAIAKYVSSLVKDGDTIQMGIGGMPNAVTAELMDKRDLGIHTEMITSGMAKEDTHGTD